LVSEKVIGYWIASVDMVDLSETAEKGVQDSCCRVSGSFPQLQKSPKDWGYRGLTESISAVSQLIDRRKK
jgi:hypothetical protein